MGDEAMLSHSITILSYLFSECGKARREDLGEGIPFNPTPSLKKSLLSALSGPR